MVGASSERDTIRSPRGDLCFQSEYPGMPADIAQEWDGYLKTAREILNGLVYPIHARGHAGIGILVRQGDQGFQDGGPRLKFDPLGNKIRFAAGRYDENIELSNIDRVFVNGNGHVQIHGETRTHMQTFVISPSGEVNMRLKPKPPVSDSLPSR